MTQKDQYYAAYKKVRSVTVSSTSHWGQPSEMDKVIESYINSGWLLENQQKIDDKNFILTFIYNMSQEEVDRESEINAKILKISVVILCIVVVWFFGFFRPQNIKKQTQSADRTATFEAAGARREAMRTATSLAREVAATETEVIAASATHTLTPSIDHKLMNIQVTVHETVNPNESVSLTPHVASASNKNVNIRSGPGTNYNVVGTLADLDEILVVGIDGDWYQIQLDESLAYVASWLIDLPENTIVPVAVTLTDTPTSTSTPRPTLVERPTATEENLSIHAQRVARRILGNRLKQISANDIVPAIIIDFEMSENLFTSWMIRGAELEIIEIVCDLRQIYVNYRFQFQVYADAIDSYGNESQIRALAVRLTENAVNEINCRNQSSIELENISETYIVSPAVWN